MRLEDFFIQYGKQDRQPGEFVESVYVPQPDPKTKIRIVKLSKRFDSDVSAVCEAFAVALDKNGNLLRRWWLEDLGTEVNLAAEPSLSSNAIKAPVAIPIVERNVSGSVTRPISHNSAKLHVTGRAQYIDDIPEPAGILHLAFGMSKHAHAQFRWKDLDSVRRAPGVVALYTAADIPGENNVRPIAKDDLLMAFDTVTCQVLI